VLSFPDFQTPSGFDMVLLAAFGILAVVGNVFMMLASFYAPAAIVGPIQYSQMLWAILLGYLVFGDKVDWPMGIGIALIVGSGLLTLMRERKRHTPLPPPVVGKGDAALAIKPEQGD
jgi:drug/metabolite transporter (DMT)-like permease